MVQFQKHHECETTSVNLLIQVGANRANTILILEAGQFKILHGTEK